MQKPPFCTPKTILLHCKNHTFEWRLCNIQIMNTLRTLREYISNSLRMRGEYVYAGTINRPLRLLMGCHFAVNGLLITQRTPTKCPRNIPQGVGADSSRPYPNITKYAFLHYQIHIFILSHTHFRSSFCRCFRICGHDKSAPTAADGLPITLRTHHETPTNIPQGVGADSSRPYPNITKYVYSSSISWVHSYMRAR